MVKNREVTIVSSWSTMIAHGLPWIIRNFGKVLLAGTMVLTMVRLSDFTLAAVSPPAA